MLKKPDPLTLQHIGTVQNAIQEPEYIQWSEVVSQIVIHPEYLEAVPEVGIFACRCPYRPNAIGGTTVPILDITGNVLTVKGLDAIDMTPVIKPFTPQYDFAARWTTS